VVTRPELVLLDVQLPDLDGLELAERLIALDANVRIVLTSSRARGLVPKAELTGVALAAALERAGPTAEIPLD
jgi:CheY-like chemotaxis protein